jgi:beta-glucosidase
MKKITLALLLGVIHVQAQDHLTITNAKGPTLGYTASSGVHILNIGKLHFKDLNKNGKLDKYEDWRLPAAERAKDLVSKMSVEQMAGLMLYSLHQAIPSHETGFAAGTYNGQPFSKSGAAPSDISDQQKKFLQEDNLRHILITTVANPGVAAEWNNKVQAYAESLPLGIPVNNSSDPRHVTQSNAEFNAGAGGAISQWPDGLGLAATFDPAIVQQFGTIAAQEYRALGITTALSPQVDLATEPRWYRLISTFGESPALSTDMARAYIDGFQTSNGPDEIKDGWGWTSVNTMVKHWPGGGPEEGGRDGHFAYGKFAVYPGKNFAAHTSPFVDGALQLSGKTKTTAAVMPYYTISWGIDPSGKNVGNGYSRYLLTDVLRQKYQYDGVICTDWIITANEGATPDIFEGKPWGMETQTVNDRHYQAIMAGVDQFGGNNDVKPVIAAYQMGVKEHGEAFMKERFQRSAIRLLKNIFRVGLFEDPYLEPAKSKAIVGNPAFMKAGFDAQLKSVVLLKNHGNTLPVTTRKTVYIPKIYYPMTKNWWGIPTLPHFDYPVDTNTIKKYYNITDIPAQADLSIVFVTSPVSAENGYSADDRKAGGNGYVPISLQYGPYKAVDAREQSIAAGDPVAAPDVKNRSYKGKTTTANNFMDLQTILDTRSVMNGKPVIVVVNVGKPMVFSEFEKVADGIVIHFGVSTTALMEIISGKTAPSGLLPLQMPKDMTTVELQQEDVPFDMNCYQDADGHTYDFGYGLDWKGVIQDSRNTKYHK